MPNCLSEPRLVRMLDRLPLRCTRPSSEPVSDSNWEVSFAGCAAPLVCCVVRWEEQRQVLLVNVALAAKQIYTPASWTPAILRQAVGAPRFCLHGLPRGAGTASEFHRGAGAAPCARHSSPHNCTNGECGRRPRIPLDTLQLRSSDAASGSDSFANPGQVGQHVATARCSEFLCTIGRDLWRWSYRSRRA